MCGFLAKNSLGLGIHMSKHKRIDDVSNSVLEVRNASCNVLLGEESVFDVLNTFGSLLIK